MKNDAPAAATLEIQIFGGLSLSYRDQPVELSNQKAKALLCYLAMASNGRASREHLVGLLWSETEEEKARASLRQVVRTLRVAFDAVEFKGLHASRNELVLQPSTFTTDVALVQAALDEARVDPVLLQAERVADSLLSGFDDLDPSFRSWLIVQRENLSQRLIRGLEAALYNTSQTEHGSGQAAAEALIRLDPTHESACRHLIRCHADKSDTSGALNIYNRLWNLLESDYDMEPSEATQQLIAEVKAGTYKPSRANGSAQGNQQSDRKEISEKKLILVLAPFDLDAVSEEKKYIGVGFRYELISRLARFREWSLVDAEAVGLDAYGQSEIKPDYFIASRLFLHGGDIQMILTLQASGSGIISWSERFSLSADMIFATQQSIVHRLASALNVHLSAERLGRIASIPDIPPQIYDRWLYGQYLLNRWLTDDRPHAVELFESIAAEAPSFSAAYSALAQMENTNHISQPGRYRTAEAGQRALDLSRRAVELDPLDSRAHLCLGWSIAFESNFDQATESFRQAIQLNESDPWTNTSAAWGLANCDRLSEASYYSRLGIEMSPLPTPTQWCYRCQVAFANQDYEDCLLASERAGDVFRVTLAWRAASLVHLGEVETAAVSAKRFFEVVASDWQGENTPTNTVILDWLGQCFPFGNRLVWERLRTGLALATAPSEALIDQSAK